MKPTAMLVGTSVAVLALGAPLTASIIALLFWDPSGALATKKHVLLIVLTHGDDNIAVGPLMARYSAEGHTVDYAMFTGLQDPSGEENSPARGEVLCASRALGVHETFVMRGPWATHVTKTLGGTVFLRLAMPATTRGETDIFDGL
jgi:hypothetical protein